MHISSEQIDLLREAWEAHYVPMPIRIQFTAGWGCTVMEVFDQSAPSPSIPLQRIVLK